MQRPDVVFDCAATCPRRSCHFFRGEAAFPTTAPEKIKAHGAAGEHRPTAVPAADRARTLATRPLRFGISYAYIPRIEAGARTPSVKALRKVAGKLGVTVEHLETGQPTSIEQGIADAGLEFGSLTAKELRTVQTAADEGARESARQAAEQVIEDRREAEVASLRKRLDELSE